MKVTKSVKKAYIDIIVGGRFYKQIPYSYCSVFPVYAEDLKEAAVKAYPHLNGKEFMACLSEQRIGRR
jgi:hypothetical protein